MTKRSDKKVKTLETLRRAGIIPGIKVDTGAKALANHPGEKVTEGLDGLRGRLAEYFGMGARFAKWRAVFSISDRFQAAVVSMLTRKRWRATRSTSIR